MSAIVSSQAAHPRSRGENSDEVWREELVAGSSPLTRGKPRQPRRPPRVDRLIPAHAGKTAADAGCPSGRRAHPRSRGENMARPDRTGKDRGSSPLTRGKLSVLWLTVASAGLIPAHAGKTRLRLRRVRPGSAHPRSRGENDSARRAFAQELGSSPLTRGKLCTRSASRAWSRLIPAHAGKTRGRSKTPCAKPAHPRSRGENDRHCTVRSPVLGSSPLTRGKRVPGCEVLRDARLIPAHAGKTGRPARPRGQREAHPRSRGENSSVSPSPESELGSSPLTRGKPASSATHKRSTRLIPAHTGKTHVAV